ncbi:hypothetical protein [Photobacterium galatheae]|uniref:Uncharacterized protein n=1 Tax=Photobacterium galatheae TaxID=1654360 RepID=A0A066RYZ7_9GAMM|nr:hypothetical protein [Photobacterium galatheae]KDM92917.1 hypothetical protein EA58_03950 [Photobacterium galatheae]MCM0148118.1 hypothetical protein [Photobacterium galatheae]
MVKQKNNKDDIVTCNLSLWHRPFGLVIFIVSAVLIALFPYFPVQYLTALLSLWSVLRKKEMVWRKRERQWSYRVRRFFLWRQTSHQMTDRDALILYYEKPVEEERDGTIMTRYGWFELEFEPEASRFDPDGQSEYQAGVQYRLKKFDQDAKAPELTEMMKQIIGIYRASNMDVKIAFGLTDLDDERYIAIKTALGLDPTRIPLDEAFKHTDEALGDRDMNAAYFEVKRYRLKPEHMKYETNSAEHRQ